MDRHGWRRWATALTYALAVALMAWGLLTGSQVTYILGVAVLGVALLLPRL